MHAFQYTVAIGGDEVALITAERRIDEGRC
jgi:hypothetical protein